MVGGGGGDRGQRRHLRLLPGHGCGAGRKGQMAPGPREDAARKPSLTLQLAASVASALASSALASSARALRVPLLSQLCLRPGLGGQLHREGSLPACTHGDSRGWQRTQRSEVGRQKGGRCFLKPPSSPPPHPSVYIRPDDYRGSNKNIFNNPMGSWRQASVNYLHQLTCENRPRRLDGT